MIVGWKRAEDGLAAAGKPCGFRRARNSNASNQRKSPRMTVLITGGAGFIGGHTVLALLDRGEVPVVLDDLSTGTRAAVPPGVRLYVGDVADAKLVSRLIRQHSVDAVLHFAAKIVVPDSVADPLGYYMANTLKTHALLQATVRAGVNHFIFSSTAAVYGNPDIVPVPETADPRPLSPYGRSKLMSEQMLADAGSSYGLHYVALRYFNVAGADPAGRHGQSTPGATHLIKVALETALGRRPHLNVYGSDYPTPDGTCVRDYVHVSDLARAHLAALDYLRSGGASRVLNCGYGQGYSVREVIHAVKMVAGTEFEVRHAARRAGDPASVVANSDHLIKLGWKPELNDLPAMIEHAYRWEKSLAERPSPRRLRRHSYGEEAPSPGWPNKDPAVRPYSAEPWVAQLVRDAPKASA
jgi:UDP-glucose 4-epimerase